MSRTGVDVFGIEYREQRRLRQGIALERVVAELERVGLVVVVHRRGGAYANRGRFLIVLTGCFFFRGILVVG